MRDTLVEHVIETDSAISLMIGANRYMKHF